jgi:hypothetical protein
LSVTLSNFLEQSKESVGNLVLSKALPSILLLAVGTLSVEEDCNTRPQGMTLHVSSVEDRECTGLVMKFVVGCFHCLFSVEGTSRGIQNQEF